MHHFRHAEYHLLPARVLDDVSVVDGSDAEAVRVGDLLLRDEDGTDGGGGVEA